MAYTSDIAFTDTVKSIQQRKGSRNSYAKMERNYGWSDHIEPEIANFIAQQRSFFLGTANTDGQPYIQHRGGPPGFLKVIDKNTLAFADYKGNRQFITQGNLIENTKAFIFLIDYTIKARVKIWGTASVIEDSPELLDQLMPAPENYKARPEQVIYFTVKAVDLNCPQHIPVRYEREDVERSLAERDARILELKETLRTLGHEALVSP